MRVLMVHKAWRPVGGVEEHMFQVVRLLEACGHEVLPLSVEHPDNLPAPSARRFVSNVDFRSGGAKQRARAAGRAVVGWQTRNHVRALLDDEHIDVVHVLHAYHQLGSTFLPLVRRRGIPIVLDLHDYKLGCPSYRLFSDRTGEVCTICFDRPHAYLWAPTATRCWDRSALGGVILSAEAAVARAVRTYQAAGVVLVVNELQRTGVVRAGVDPSRVHVVPHPVLLPLERPTRDPQAWVIYVGRLVPEKGVDILIRASAQSGVAVRVVGEGRLKSSLEELRDQLGAPVEFVGALGPNGVRQEMLRARALIVPSVWHEVWGLVINEAVAVGLPVVGTSLGAIPDILGEGRGFLVPPNDVPALTRVLMQLRSDPAMGGAEADRAWRYAAVELSPGRWEGRLRQAYGSAGLVV